MKIAVTLLLIGFVGFGLAAILLFAEARSYEVVIRDGIGVVTLVNAEWVALLVLAAVCGSTALILAYLSRSVDVLAPSDEPNRTVAD